jgi:formylglycine-generating enzyme
MIGNVWEWTADAWTTSGDEALVRRCCTAPTNAAVQSRVLKGGSHLCAVNYCQRYRPAARHSQSALESTGHIGFRCVRQAA